MKKLVTILILTSFLQCSISENEKQEIKQIIFEKTSDEIIKENLICQNIPIETNEQNLIRTIKQVKIIEDRIFLLEESSERKVLVFDIKGRFLSQIGKIGQGPGEFNIPSQLHVDIEKRHLVIADLGKMELVYYDLDSYGYISRKSMPDFSEIIWLNDTCHISYLTSGHKTRTREKYYLMLCEESEQDIQYFDKTGFHSFYSFTIGGQTFNYNNASCVIYPFNPIIRRVTLSGTEPVYEIQFGHGELPSLEWLMQEASNDRNYIHSLTNSGKIAAFTLSETETHIQLMYLIKRQFYIGFYDKRVNKGWDMPLLGFVKQTGLSGFASVIGTHDDYFISYLYPESLKHLSEVRDDLKQIAKETAKDDNPVLCLFKFK